MQSNVIQLQTLLDRSKYCITSLCSTEHTSAISETCESFDFGTSLQRIYPVLRFVFKYLEFKDLQTAKNVNDAWETYADEELARRKNASWMSVCKVRKANFTLLERSTNFLYDDTAFGLVFYMYKNIKLDKYICLHQANERVRMPFAEYLTKEVIPKEREFWALSCSNVYRVNADSSLGKFRPYFSALLIPNIPNVTIKRFYSSTTSPGRIREVLEDNIKFSEKVDCLLVFTMSNPENSVPVLMHEMLKLQKPENIALCGGVITGGIKLFNHDDKHYLYTPDQIYCVAFTQMYNVPAEFEAFSMVIQEEDEFETKVSQFRQKVVLRKKSFIIRVCCAAKTQNEIETPLVYRYFPETFVVGLNADGEIGWNRFAEEEESHEANLHSPMKKCKILPETCHQYSTILMLITWGPKI